MVSNNKILINNGWMFKEKIEDQYITVNIPHTNKELPYNYFDEKNYQIITHYKKNIYVEDNDKRVFLKFDGVMTAFKLYVNDKYEGEHKGGFIPHFIEITDLVQHGEENIIYLEVDSTEREDIPPFGYVIDYLTFGGVYRDVYLYSLDKCFIENVLYKYEVVEYKDDKGKVALRPKVLINNEAEAGEFFIRLTIGNSEDNSFRTHIFKNSISLEKGKRWYELKEEIIEEVSLWSLESPVLYNVTLELFDLDNETTLDESSKRVGFRHLKIDSTGLYLNGEKIALRGLNRHQSFPYVGYAMPKRAQIKDADILKDELGLNLVRTSHYPQSPYFLDRCDEIGLLVLEEIPGWQHVGKNEPWRVQVLKDVEAMIFRDYDHPSIISWGIRINESRDDDELYTKTNTLARSLDSSRSTCGIRCLEKSNLLEDIYTMNDFIHDGGEKILRTRKEITGLEKPVPYLVTEFCGHIYPTKRFDCEERLVEHALRHGRVQSMAKREDEYMGAIGWCAFDYNTHFDFGSGDRICYHGVMDMFRIPKFASFIYSSQKNPKEGVVLEPLTYWTRGERNKGIVFPIYVCTNCDKVEVVFHGKSAGFFDRNGEIQDQLLSDLPYAPIKVDSPSGEWGESWNEVEFIGYIDGEKKASKRFCKNPVLKDIEVKADDLKLYGNELDTTRVVVKAVDQYGNLLPFISGSILIETEEDIECIGPNNVALIGGCIGFWIKTKGKITNSTARIKIRSSFGIIKEIAIELCKNKD